MSRRHGVWERAQQEAAKGNRIGVGMPVLAELAYGIELSASRDRNMLRLQKSLAHWRIWPFDQRAAFEYGRLAAHLRRIGRAMQTPDVMISAIALSLGNCTVASVDSDFQAVPELIVENWRSQ